MTAPWHSFSAAPGLMIWLPTSPATHTFSTFTCFSLVHAELNDFREITTMRKLESDAHGCSGRKFLRVPPRFFGGQFDDTRGAAWLKIRIIGLEIRIHDSRKGENIQAELHRVLPCSMGELVQERLEDPGKKRCCPERGRA